MPMNELRAIATFAKAVELGSLRRAAVAQGVSPQAASQTLAQLEQHLGVRLLHRTTRNLALTDEGRQLLEATQPALAALERALQRVRASKDDIAGPLRIVGPQSSFVPLLWPVIDEFCRQHPDVQPDVQLDDSIGNWVQDRVDVGFRIGAPPQDGLIARRLFPVQLIICAAPDYLARHGAPRTLEELASHRCSVFRHPGTGQVLPWYLQVDGEVVHRDMPLALSTNDTELELQAVLSGQVIAQLSGMSAAPLIREGRLVPILTQHMTDHMSVYVYYGSRTSQPARVRAFIDLAVERLHGGAAVMLSKRELTSAEAAGRKLGNHHR
ncbi:transcriptional regulator, LysR family [Rhodoferax ferrireducens T118]|uniref:Transcriptional regulator, LysR family n=1 Tax=Albidiferax ferrireducens (strain ATCC BAA-621 / DSM 15236 / T118) TaxID=338969 RepID=Q21VP8_ALBFT|nr:LysR family transcriptional regulator [Rhodoferax ferrireducens]ABD70155.1 transcriptional regulator, LysR family [Rhodoferax ferrireducens T118]